jgi:hypothetical protein
MPGKPSGLFRISLVSSRLRQVGGWPHLPGAASLSPRMDLDLCFFGPASLTVSVYRPTNDAQRTLPRVYRAGASRTSTLYCRLLRLARHAPPLPR